MERKDASAIFCLAQWALFSQIRHALLERNAPTFTAEQATAFCFTWWHSDFRSRLEGSAAQSFEIWGTETF